MFVSDADARGESLTGKHRKRLNKLARLGDLRFERLTSAEELAAVIDEIAVLYDLRQGGLGGDLPFVSDPTKSAFHLALMATPQLLHATVLRLGSHVLSAQLGLTGRGWLHFGVLAYSPLYGEHSPGVMHVRLLGQLAAREGFQAIDLTPGGAWKDRFATSHDTVSRLTVFAGRSHAIRAEVSRQTHDCGAQGAENGPRRAVCDEGAPEPRAPSPDQSSCFDSYDAGRPDCFMRPSCGIRAARE